MSTRSFVGVKIGNVYRSIYIHNDGYLAGVGRDLLSYTTQEEVEELISHGDRSTTNGGYYKDRGETGVDPIDHYTFIGFVDAAQNSGAEWFYMFMDGAWYVGNFDPNSALYCNVKLLDLELLEE